MEMKMIELSETAVIGKEGFSTPEKNVAQELWKEANENFDEVANLARKKEDGSFSGFWGAMTDETRSFLPWTENFTKGYYLAGVEVPLDAEAPEGWKKWILPARKYLVVEVQFDKYMEIFLDVLNNRIPSKNMVLCGAACDFTEPSAGKNYIYFPVKEADINL